MPENNYSAAFSIGSTPMSITTDPFANGLPPESNANSGPEPDNSRYSQRQERVDYIKSRIPGITDADATRYELNIFAYTADLIECSDYRKAIYNNDTSSKYYAGAQAIEEYIKRAPRWIGTTYRGLRSQLGGSIPILDYFKVGEEIDMKGMSSWSMSKEKAASSFAKVKKGKPADPTNNVVLVCKNQSKGTKIIGLSHFPNDKEVLVSNEARYRVIKHIPRKNYTEVIVQEI